MIHDDLLYFSKEQALTTTAFSTDTIPMSDLRDIGAGTPHFVRVNVTQALAGATSITIVVNAHMTTNPTQDATDALMSVVGASETITLSPFNWMTAGATVDIGIAPIPVTKLQTFTDAVSIPYAPLVTALGSRTRVPGAFYLTVGYIIVGTLTTGKVTTTIQPMTAAQRIHYPAGSVS